MIRKERRTLLFSSKIPMQRLNKDEMLVSLKKNSIFNCFDIETSGLSPKKGSEVIELSGVKVNIDTMEKIATFSNLVKPQKIKKIPPNITSITGITTDMVKDAPFIEPVIKDFCAFVGDQPIVFHNAIFDWDRFLIPLLQKQGFVLENDIIDTLVIARTCLPSVKSRNLKDLCHHFGYNTSFHRAINDARATAAILAQFKKIVMSASDFPILETINKKEKPLLDIPSLKISKIRCWEKKPHQRIYIETSWGSFYYDLRVGEWFVKNSPYLGQICLEDVSRKFLQVSRISPDNIPQYFDHNKPST